MFRIGELTVGEQGSVHTVKAKDMHIAMNKNKIMLVLYSSDEKFFLPIHANASIFEHAWRI